MNWHKLRTFFRDPLEVVGEWLENHSGCGRDMGDGTFISGRGPNNWLYREGDHVMEFHGYRLVEPHRVVLQMGIFSVVKWEPPYEAEEISPEKRRQLQDKITRNLIREHSRSPGSFIIEP